MNRELTEQEIDWLKQGLKTLKPNEYENYVKQIRGLRAVYKCDCGEPDCHTIHFQHFEKAKSVSLVMSSTDDGRMLFILEHEDNWKLSELEII